MLGKKTQTAAGLVSTFLTLFLTLERPAFAQSPTPTQDSVQVAQYERQFSTDYIARLIYCDILIPGVGAKPETNTRRNLQRQAHIARACWSVAPSVSGAFALSRILEALGDDAGANAAIEAAQARFPTRAELYVGLAGRKARAGDVAGANALLDQAIAIGPGNARDPDYWTSLAEPLLGGENVPALRLRLFDEAWKRASQRSDKDEKVRVLLVRARAYFSEKRYAESMADLNTAMPFTSTSDRDEVLLLSARIKKALGDGPGATADFKAAVELSPATASDEFHYRRREAVDNADAACRAAAAIVQGQPTGLGNDVDAAIAAADECIAAGQPALGLILKASERVRLGDRSMARELIAKALEADATFAFAYALRGANEHAAGDYAASLVATSRAIELAPQEARYYVQRAVTHRALADHASARRDYETALSIDPRRIDDILDYVNTLSVLGDHRCAMAALNVALTFSLLDSKLLAARAPVWNEVRKLPREQRTCAAPVAYGKGFVF